jgi:hypothetical protein
MKKRGQDNKVDWIKHLTEFLSKSFRNNLIASIATGFILFAPEQLKKPLNLDVISIPYLENIVGIIFLFSAIALGLELLNRVYTQLEENIKKIINYLKRNWVIRRGLKRITDKELNMIRLTLNYDSGVLFYENILMHRTNDWYIDQNELFKSIDKYGLGNFEDYGEHFDWYIYLEKDVVNIIKKKYQKKFEELKLKFPIADLEGFEKVEDEDWIPF